MVGQVESATDIAKNFEQREKTDGGSSHHTLKMALGDGRQTVSGVTTRRLAMKFPGCGGWGQCIGKNIRYGVHVVIVRNRNYCRLGVID